LFKFEEEASGSVIDQPLRLLRARYPPFLLVV